jgi:hypothetical protein
MDIVVLKVSIIVASIAPVEFALSVFLAILVEAFVASAVRPGLYSVALLLILEPSSSVAGIVQMCILSLLIANLP